MSTFLAIALASALCAAFGLVVRLERRNGHGGSGAGCSSCASVCHRKESRHD